MRAVAILLVVCAHAGVPWLAGGFVGVDVFFVLSGYLITGLLLREFEDRGRIDFPAFYARRVQRLFPGLALVVACTSLSAIALLAPFEQPAQANAAAAAVTWTSNFLFALHQLDYFGPAADSNLFLHTWSLGVEEQFYLLWPAWVLFLLGAWSWQGQQRNRRHLAGGLIATGLVCLLASIYMTYHEPQAGFYMVFSRGWQFALGALAFLLLDGKPLMRGERLTGWLGLFAIIATALILDGNTPYPGYWALAPSLGTALLLASGRETAARGQIGALLSVQPMQWIGLVSYAWYLWHWPVLLLGATLVPASNGWHSAMLASISLALAGVSYRVVEAPIRQSRWLKAHPWVALAGTMLVAGSMLFAISAWTKKAEKWSAQPGQLRYVIVRGDQPAIYALGCDDWYHSADVHPCTFGNPKALHTAVLMGDSIAGQWFPAIARHFDRPDWRLVVITKSACPMVDEPVFYAPIGREYVECERWRNDALSAIADLHPDIVLFSSSPDYAFTPGEWTDGTARVLDRIAESASKIVVVGPTPVLPFDGPACLARRDWRRKWISTQDPCHSSNKDGQFPAIERALRDAVAGQPQARFLELGGVVCPSGSCQAENDGVVVYRDRRHLTRRYVTTLESDLDEALDRAWRPAKSDILRH